MNTVSLLVLLASLIELQVVSTSCNTKQTTCQVFNKTVNTSHCGFGNLPRLSVNVLAM